MCVWRGGGQSCHTHLLGLQVISTVMCFGGLPGFSFPIFRTITLKLNSVNLELDLNFMALDVKAVYIHTLLSYTDVAF